MTTVNELFKIAVIDDDADVRDLFEIQVELWDREPVVFSEDRLGAIEGFLERSGGFDAGITDFKLQTSGYAQFNGAELASRWMRRKVPAILCTRFESAEIIHIRPHLRYIPAILQPDELKPEMIERAFERGLQEIAGRFVEDRKPWRAQVHFLDSDNTNPELMLVELPSWQGSDRIWVSRSDLPAPLQKLVRPGYRTFAQANLGAEAGLALYLTEWEVRE